MTLARRLTASAVALAVAAGVALVGAPPALADPPSSNTILFEDDFTGSADAAFDSGKWTDWSGCTYDSTAYFGAIACGDSETLDGSGHLRVPATPTTGSALRSDFTFDYGVASAWIKLPTQEGYWPAFWSLNNDFGGGAATTSDPVGEVDIMETWTKFSHQNPGLSKALGHTWTGDGSADYHSADNTCSTSGGLDGAYHKYSAKYEPNKITYYVDDVECGTRYEPSSDPARKWGLGPAVTDDNWLILDLAIGDAGGQQAAPTANATMLVDRVEVRALDEASPAIVSGTTYKVENTCGGKVLGVTGSGIEQVTTQTWSGSDLQRWQAITTTGSYFKLKNVSSGKTMNIAYSSGDNGAQVIQYSDNGGPNAEFTIAPGLNGVYEISAHNSGKFLDVPGGATGTGVGLIQWGHSGTCAQKHRLVAL